MVMGQIRLVNTDSRGLPLAVDAQIAYKRKISCVIPPNGFVNVAGIASLEDLNANPTISQLRTNKQIRIDIQGGDDLVPIGGVASAGLGIGETLRGRWALPASGATGTADDILLVPSMPYPARILSVTVLTSTNISGSSITLRSAAAGAGSALSSAIATAATGRQNSAATATAAIAAGSALYARRTDRAVVGEILIEFLRTG